MSKYILLLAPHMENLLCNHLSMIQSIIFDTCVTLYTLYCLPGTLQELISHTMIHWAQESFIQNPELVRMMFSLLHRQYDGLGELMRALPKAYTINQVSIHDTMDLLECLGQIRSLLIVQMGPEEERLMIQSIG